MGAQRFPANCPRDEVMLPEMSVTTQAVFRAAYGTVLLGTVLWNSLQGRRFFISERWGGYGQQSVRVDVLQNPVCYPLILAVWIASAVGIILGWGGIWPALVNVLLCRYYFIAMRWSGVLRGMGAPGFMTYWLGVAVLLLEYTLHHAPLMRSLALLVLQVDWALIMVTAGIYKFTAGYPRNLGMELGMANPQWGTWASFYAGVRPSHWCFWFLNQMAWTTEIAAGILMLIPQTRWIGGMLISMSFLFVGSQIRLNHLTVLLALTGLLFITADSPPSPVLITLLGDRPLPNPVVAFDSSFVNYALAMVLMGYLILLPAAYTGLYYNFYGRKRLPGALQPWLERYTNFFGMILWRVFSVNLIDFFIRIYLKPRAPDAEPTLVSNYGWGGPPRFNHVGESIAITTVFTTLKYYPDNVELFQERLLRYARTIRCPEDHVLLFDYITIRKAAHRFEFIPMAEYTVDPHTGEVTEKLLRLDAPVRAASPVSRIHRASAPGSYAPASPETPERAHGN
jgi:hypothetical protein